MYKREFEKTSGVHESARKPMKKVCDENERKKEKNDCRIKTFVVTGRHFYKAVSEEWLNQFLSTSGY